MSALKSNLSDPTEALLRHVLEGDEDDLDIKDLLSTDPTGGKATVERHGRWKLVRTRDYTFLISYLTPVAYYDKVENKYYRTSKWWSMTTENHISEWQKMIWKSPEWQVPENMEKSEYSDSFYPKYPHFEKRPQREVSGLFLEQMKVSQLTAKEKKRLYHVDPQMRQGSDAPYRSRSGHLKHHDTEGEGLPLTPEQLGAAGIPDDFFKDFKPDKPEFFDWDEGHEGRTYLPYEPDERGRRPKDE